MADAALEAVLEVRIPVVAELARPLLLSGASRDVVLHREVMLAMTDAPDHATDEVSVLHVAVASRRVVD